MLEIPFNRPSCEGRELAHVADAISSGHMAGDGPYSKKVECLLQETLAVPRVLLTTSCTHALEVAALLLDLQAGDEVIVPAFTFVSTVNAFVLRGARPVFVDIRPDTLNMDEAQLPDRLTERTRAIFLIHYAGVGCEMDSVCRLADGRHIPVVEDNAQGLFGRYRGRELGTIGTFGALSFHETKNFSCGEGGALILKDASHIERAEIIREKGTDRSRFIRGQVDKYTWTDIGSSYILSDMLAAFLYGQLEMREQITAKRQMIWQRYADGLRDWSVAHGVSLPYVPPHCAQPYHMFYLLMPSEKERDGLIHELRKRGMGAAFHYLPLHLSKMGSEYGYRRGDFPVTEDISARLVRLPFFTSLSQSGQNEVIDAIASR
jgi:dTDP-4-amino-4,6-dideoxygalactose transaminase